MALVNVCSGCLSTERKLTSIKPHNKLFQQLLLEKSNKNTKKLSMCWECCKILNNIHAFRLKITQAQRLLRDKGLSQHNSLSSLSMSSNIDAYNLIIYEDEKINIAEPEVTVEVKKEEESSEYEGKNVDVEVNIDVFKEEFKHEDGSSDHSILEVSNDMKNDFDGDIAAINDFNDDFSDNDKPDEALVPVEILAKKENIAVRQGRRKRGVLKKKYRTIIMDIAQDKRNLYDIITIDQKDAALEIKKKTEKLKKFRCTLCYRGFAQQKCYDRHMKIFHNQKHKYVCDVCGCRYADVRGVRGHVPTHFQLFRCRLCAQEFNTRHKVYAHFKHGPHARQMECKMCFQRFDCQKRKEFFDHYRESHSRTWYVCDHCGSRRGSKLLLERHIKVRHVEIRCPQCNMTFSSRHSLKKHGERKHTRDASERNYCVECDIQFLNTALYAEHVGRSARHNPHKPKVKCLACDKTYSKPSYMKNHYNLVHLKSSKYVCPICERHFLNASRLQWHVKYYHEKMPKPRNCICSYCGRGFTTRRTLEHHVRTHTGERPHACARCPAAFAQPTALKTHERNAHK